MKKYNVTSKEADLYLDNTYSSKVYKSSEEFIYMQNKFKGNTAQLPKPKKSDIIEIWKDK